MTPLAGPVHAVALVVLAAGAGKAARPATTVAALRAVGLPGSRRTVRLLAAAEIAVAVAVLAGVGRPAAAGLAVLFGGFVAVAARLRRQAAGCGCFGQAAPVSGTHLAVNGAATLLALAAVADPVPSLGAAVAGTPAAGVPYVALVGLLAAGQVLCLTALPDLQHAAAVVRADAGSGSGPVR